jgi:hypothetical protein
MQTATGAIISGLATGYLLDHDVIPTRLDFYTSDFTYTSVLRFFDLASVYDGWAQNCVRDHDGVAHVTTYFDPSSDDFIQISKSHTDSPMDLVPHAPFSHLFAAVTHYGMWLGYPDTTMARISYPNRDMIRFGDPRSFYHMTSVIGDYIEDYRFRFSLDRGHLCGSSFECPVTPRHTADEGCLNLFFPCAPFAAPSDATSVYPTRSAMSWSLDARGCPRGRPEMPGRLEIRQREDGCESCLRGLLFSNALVDTYWKREMEEVIMKAAWRRIFRRLILIT